MGIISIPEQEFNLYAVSDLHLDHVNSLHSAFKYVIEKIKNDPKAKVIFLGDMLDLSVRASVRDESERRMSISDALMTLSGYLKPIAPKIVGMVTGNHERKTAKRYLEWYIEPTLCNMLGINPAEIFKSEESIESIGLSVFRLNDKKKNPHTKLYKVFYTHGTKGGSIGNVLRSTSNINHVEGVDMKIVGHFHEFGLTVQGVMYVDRFGNIRTKTQTSVALSSFLPTTNFLLTKTKRVSIPVLAKFNVKLDLTSDEIKTTPYIETLEQFVK